MRFPRWLALLLPLVLGACAAIQDGAHQAEEARLTRAGFQAVQVQTVNEYAALKRMPPYQLETREKNGIPVYRYADTVKQVVYMGGPTEYAAYQKLLAQKSAQAAQNMAELAVHRGSYTGPLVW